MERHGHSLAHLDIDIRAAAELVVVPGTPAVSVAAALLEQPSYHRQLLPPMKHSVRSWCIDGGLRGWVLNLQRPYHHATCPLAAHTVDARAIGGYHALVYRAAANRDKSSRLTGRPPGCPAALGGHRVQCPAVGARTAAVYRLGGWGDSPFTGWPASRTGGNPVGARRNKDEP